MKKDSLNLSRTKSSKKYNSSTGCYKIDIFINGNYYCSTDQHKTCKSATESVKSKLQDKSKNLPYYVEDVKLSIVCSFFHRVITPR